TTFAETAQRTDDLAEQTDSLRADLEMTRGAVAAVAPTLIEPPPHENWPSAPAEPWSDEYVKQHRAFVSRALDDPDLMLRFRRGQPLPEGYGVGFDERVIEFPWTLTRDLSGTV